MYENDMKPENLPTQPDRTEQRPRDINRNPKAISSTIEKVSATQRRNLAECEKRGITDVEGCFGIGTHLYNLVDSKPTLTDHDRSSQRLPCPFSQGYRYTAIFSASPQPLFVRIRDVDDSRARLRE